MQADHEICVTPCRIIIELGSCVPFLFGTYTPCDFLEAVSQARLIGVVTAQEVRQDVSNYFLTS